MKSGDELRSEIAAVRRFTREPRFLALLDSIEEYLDSGAGQDNPARAKKREYMRGYMQRYRAKQRLEKKNASTREQEMAGPEAGGTEKTVV